MIQDYTKAKKLGERAYRRAVVKGQYPYLPSLEQMVEEVDRFPEIPLGLAEIPLDRIVGTRTSGRQNAFAANFMPLMAENSEFAAKWSHLYDAQVEEGIRDPVKVYEFMNRFYVEEGNKRVSVLRFVGAVSVMADIIRIRPPRTDTEQSRLYYEYLDFYKVTKSFEIVFSAPGRYEQLARILQQDLQAPWPEALLEKLHAGFTVFCSAYRAKGGWKMSLTEADAFLVYLGFYSLDSLLREGEGEIGRRLMRLWREFAAASHPDGIVLIERKEDAAATDGRKTPLGKVAEAVGKKVEKTVEKTNAAGVAGVAELAGAVAAVTGGQQAAKATRDAVRSGLSAVLPTGERFSPAHPLKAAFLYEGTPDASGWIYGHELGRNHVEEAFGSLVQTLRFEGCGDEEAAQRAFSAVREEKCGIVFTTAPSLAQCSLRFALENPQIRVLNCSFNQAGNAVRFYYGKMYEAKFLMGALAASLTDDHRIGYYAGRRDPAAFANINAFALGAQLIDPFARVELEWIGAEARPGDPPAPVRGERKIHVFSDIDMVRLDEPARRYGLYLMEEDGTCRRLAAPVWNWGTFYELMLRRVLDGTYGDIAGQQKERALNYWLGMSSGIIDIIFSDSLPRPSYRLISQLRRAITQGQIHPFAGSIEGRGGEVHGTEDGVLSNEEILSMDWLVENVDVQEEPGK